MTLRFAAVLNFILAGGHIAVMPWLDTAFRIYGIDRLMNGIAAHGAALPYIITAAIASCFALCGLYALSADGAIRRLPMLWPGVFFVSAVFLLRAAIGIIIMTNSGQYPLTDSLSAIVSSVIGLLYLAGGAERIRSAER